MNACVVGIDAVSMGLLAISVQIWEGTDNAKTANTTFVALQLLSLCGRSRWYTYHTLSWGKTDVSYNMVGQLRPGLSYIIVMYVQGDVQAVVMKVNARTTKLVHAFFCVARFKPCSPDHCRVRGRCCGGNKSRAQEYAKNHQKDPTWHYEGEYACLRKGLVMEKGWCHNTKKQYALLTP